MSHTAVHLEQGVLPEVPVRHWVCTWPWGVRAVLGFDKGLCREATRAFIGELSRSLWQRAKSELGLSSVKQALTGAIAVVQRTNGALRLNVHLHVLALDGVYVRDESRGLAFHALPTPSRAQVEEVARGTAKRLHRVFQRAGRPSPWDELEHSEEEPRSPSSNRGSFCATKRRRSASDSRASARGNRRCGSSREKARPLRAPTSMSEKSPWAKRSESTCTPSNASMAATEPSSSDSSVT